MRRTGCAPSTAPPPAGAKAIGVCGTEPHIFAGDQPYLGYPRAMGHELSGTVEEVPAGSALRSGDVVSILPYLSCGACNVCRGGASPSRCSASTATAA